MSKMVEWKTENRVGIFKIDEQHQNIFRILNKLATAIEEDKDRKILLYILSDLVKHFNYHFTDEEIYLEVHPDFNDHHQKHWELTEKILDFEKQSRKNTAFNFGEVLDFLNNWLKNHIFEADIEYFQYVREKSFIESID
jgi:hemerythrin